MGQILRIILGFFFCVSCAGYQLNNYENPLKKWGIENLRVLNFYNESNFLAAGSICTEKTYQELSELKDLKLTSLNKKADGVLIGIVSSDRLREDSLRSSSKVVAGRIAPNSTNSNNNFNVTATNTVEFYVDYYLVKDKDLENFLKIKKANKEIVKFSHENLFHKRIRVSGTLLREIYDGSGTAVNQTQNEKALERKIEDLASQAAKEFKYALMYEK